MPTESPTTSFIRMVRELSPDGNREAAARAIIRQCPDLTLEVMETIGSYPSSEPELRALQAVWGHP